MSVEEAEILRLAENAIIAVGARDDEDLAQTGRLAAWEAVGRWKPDVGALSTWISAAVKGAIINARLETHTGGIGSRRTTQDGSPAEHISMSDDAYNDDEEDGDPMTHQDAATYYDTDHVPEGFGDPGREIQRQMANEAVKELLSRLSDEEVYLLACASVEGLSMEEYALWEDIHKDTAYEKIQKLRIKIRRKQKTCYIQGTGTRKAASPTFWNDAVSTVEGNPVWSQKTGPIWGDWSWKESEEKK